jgi:hypothetical protein
MNNYEDAFIRIINKPDQSKPEVWHRELEQVVVSSRFFGLLNDVEYRYTEWVKQENT